MRKDELVAYLERDDFNEIFALADKVRQEEKGDYIDIRAILEFSNYCRANCKYCGLSCKNTSVSRYRMTPEEMIETAKQSFEAGYQTIVLQSGEDPYYTKDVLGDIVREIKKTGIIVTLSCGERTLEEYAHFKLCGADRYLIKHETADERLYNELHPHSTFENRVNCLKAIKSLGYELGSGFMIGLPNQTLSTIADDLLLLKSLKVDMAGIGPFIPHPKTELAHVLAGSTELTRKAVALARILLPHLNLPATTSLGVVNSKDKDKIFSTGANVIMHKVTPSLYREKYEIYPSNQQKTNIMSDRLKIEQQIKALGKIPR